MNAVIAPDTSEGASSFVGTLLRRTRLAARLTADDLAAQIGVSETTVRRWEGELNQPTAHHLARLATVLGVAPAALLGGIPPRMSLRSLRELVPLSLLDAARLSGLSPSALSRLERGQTTRLSTRAGLALAHTYGCTKAQLGDAYSESVALRQLRAQVSERLRQGHDEQTDCLTQQAHPSGLFTSPDGSDLLSSHEA